jgi:hypothetical protein
MARAVVRALAVNAARGQLRSQQLFATLIGETERANKARHDKWPQTAIECKQHWTEELRRRRQLGISGVEPLPRPGDIIINMKTGGVIVKGPMTPEDNVGWDRLHDRIRESDRALEETTVELERTRKPSYRNFLEDDIAHERRLREILVNALGEPGSG